MSEGLNRVTLFGNLGTDPELRRLQSGTSLLRMRLATNYSFMNKEGVREERTEWHTVIVWGPRAEGLARFLAKGQGLVIEGQIRTSSYEKDGEKRYSTEIHAENVFPTGGRRSASEARHDTDDIEPLPFGMTSADLRDDSGRYDAPGGQRDPDEFEPVPHGPGNPDPHDEGGAAELPPPRPRKKPRSPTPAPAMAMATA